MPYSVVTGDRTVPLTLTNITDNPVYIKAGTTMGTIGPFEGLIPDAYSENMADPGKPLNVRNVSISGDDLPAPNISMEDRIAQCSELRELRAQLPQHLLDLHERSSLHLDNEQSIILGKTLSEFSDVFSVNDLDLGCFKEITHSIDTGNHPPTKTGLRRVPFKFQAEEEEHLKKMLDIGVIEPSTSDWSAAPVLVRKKDGGLRWCIDYRELNAKTTKVVSTLPLIADCLDTLGGNQ